MIWIAVPIVLAILLACGSWREPYSSAFDSALFGLFLGAIIGAVCLVVSSMLAAYSFEAEPPPMNYKGRSNILSLQDNSSTQGNFFLGSGSVEEKPVFWYYKDRGDYSTLEYQYAYKSRIIESDVDQPYIEYYGQAFDWHWLYFSVSEEGDYAEFHVPEGSIVNNYNLDAKP